MSTNQNLEDKNTQKSPMKLIAILAVIVVIGIAAFFMTKGGSKTPYDKINEASMQLQKAKTLEIKGNATISNTVNNAKEEDKEDIEKVNEMINSLAYNYEFKMDKDNSKYFGSFGYSIKDTDLININLYADSNSFQLNVPALSSKTLYFKWDDYDNMAEKLELPKLHIKDYKKLLNITDYPNFKKLEKKYMDLSKKELAHKATVSKEQVEIELDSKKYNTKEYSFALNQEESFNFNKKIIDTIKEDKDLKEFLISKGEDFLKIARSNGDAEILEIPKDFSFDTEENRSKMDEFITEMASNFDDIIKMTNETGVDTNVVTKYRIDEKDILRQMVQESTSTTKVPEEGLDMTISTKSTFDIINFNEPVTIDELDKTNLFDLGTATEQDFMDLKTEVQGNMMGIFMAISMMGNTMQ
ncbi:MAG: hypothetical protein N4A54_13095 [Peptostreptococcaceae bacterium]|jgi:hypothetical protein|nr:hypothetical protein [Peptostreptococcaceae bacterium]